MKTRLLPASSLVLAAGLAFAPAAVLADTATGSLDTRITITSNCAVSTGNAALDFGSHASTETSASAGNGGFSVSCTNKTPYKIALIPTSTSSTDGAGEMKFDDVAIAYQLYQDLSMQTPWGSMEANEKSGVGAGEAQSYVVYGKVTGSMNVPAGNYADTVTISVSY